MKKFKVIGLTILLIILVSILGIWVYRKWAFEQLEGNVDSITMEEFQGRVLDVRPQDKHIEIELEKDIDSVNGVRLSSGDVVILDYSLNYGSEYDTAFSVDECVIGHFLSGHIQVVDNSYVITDITWIRNVNDVPLKN